MYGPGFRMFWLWGAPYRMLEFSIGLTHEIYVFCYNFTSDRRLKVLAKGDRECILFFAMEKKVLYDVVACVILLKKMTPYKIMGVVYPRQMIIAKRAIKRIPV